MKYGTETGLEYMPRINNYIAKVRPEKNENTDISIILISSMNYKMKSYGPRELLKLNCGRTFIDYQIQTIRNVFPTSEIILSVGQDADKIVRNKPYKLKIVENQLWETTNNAEYARLALNASVTEKVILIDSDVYFDLVAIQHLQKIKSSCFIYDESDRLPDDEVGMLVIDGNTTVFSFQHKAKWCHIAQLVGDDLEYFKKLLADKNRKKQLLFEVFNSLVDRKHIPAERTLSKVIYRVETSRDFEKIKNETQRME